MRHHKPTNPSVPAIHCILRFRSLGRTPRRAVSPPDSLGPRVGAEGATPSRGLSCSVRRPRPAPLPPTSKCAMMRSTPPRPWYCPDSLVDEYRALLLNGGDFRMLRTLQIFRSIVVNLGLFIIIVLAIQEGVASPFVVGIAIATIGLYNGIELTDYQALARAVAELQAPGQDDSGEEE